MLWLVFLFDILHFIICNQCIISWRHINQNYCYKFVRFRYRQRDSIKYHVFPSYSPHMSSHAASLTPDAVKVVFIYTTKIVSSLKLGVKKKGHVDIGDVIPHLFLRLPVRLLVHTWNRHTCTCNNIPVTSILFFFYWHAFISWFWNIWVTWMR